MSDADADDPQVALGAVPSPTARYAVTDGAVVLTATNDAFEATFAVEAEVTVREWWAAADLAARDLTAEGLATALAAGESVETDGLRCGTGSSLTLRAWPTAEDGGVIALATVDAGGVEAERIARVVSHDLRNPLDVAAAHLRAARDSADGPVADHLEAVDAAHDRMERIVRDVLTLARGEGAVDPQDDVAVGTVARRAWETVDTRTATLSVAADLPTVEADPDRLRRLLENLFRNAVEHGSTGSQAPPDDAVEHGSTGNQSPTGDVAERSSAGSQTESGDPGVSVRVDTLADGTGFAVADDGPGVPATEREVVFTPGYSTDDTGTGLGLTIVERIAEAHGWTAAVAESEHGGARVEFRLDGDRQ